jgi:dTDP-4-amino-4,6-dideoxygalactose transaminase
LLGLPTTASGCKHVWNQYTIRVADGRRDALRQYLSQVKVGTEIYYPVPLHQQACFRSLSYGEGSLPESERAARETLALPIFAELEAAEIETVVYRIAEFFGIRRPQVDPAVRRPHFLTHPAALPEGLPKVA